MDTNCTGGMVNMKLFEVAELLPVSKQLDIIKTRNQIIRSCQPFVTQIGKDNIFKAGHMLYRGSRVLHSQLTTSETFTDRRPLDTPPIIHHLFNEILFKKYGVKFRSDHVLFTTGKEDIAGTYGHVNTIFPIGEFKFLWFTTSTDLYLFFLNLIEDDESFNLITQRMKLTTSQITELQTLLELACETDHSIDELTEDEIQLLTRCLENVILFAGPKFNVDLPKAIASGHEIMVHCKTYYSIDTSEIIKPTSMSQFVQSHTE